MLKIKLQPLHFFDFLIVLFMILDTHSIYNVTVYQDYHIISLLIGALALRVLFGINSISKKIALVVPLWLFYISIFFVISAFGSVGFIQRFILLPILFMMYFDQIIAADALQRVLGIYIKIIKWIMGISLFFWVFASLLDIIPSTDTVTIQWGKLVNANSFFGIFFNWQNDAFFMGKQFFRNIGIFTEAPMYSLHISMAYLLECVILRRQKWSTLLFYIVTVVSSYSVTGILLIVMSQVMMIVFSSLSDSLRHRRLNLVLLLAPIAILIAVGLGSNLLSSKLDSGSGGSRKEDYLIGYRAWMYNPWFGAGYGDISLINSLKSMLRFSRSATGYTNSPMYLLTEGGLYFFLSFAYGLLHYLVKSFVVKNHYLFIFAIMVLYLFLTTTFQHTALLIALISFACVTSVGKVILQGKESSV